MARKSKQDIAKAKAAKQKKLAIAGGVLLVLLLAYQAPKTMKMLNQKPKPPIVDASAVPAATTTPTDAGAAPAAAVPADPNSLAAPTLGASAATTTMASSSDLVSAVPVSADPGQLQTFEKFASKDPFAAQVSDTGAPTAGSSSPSKGSSSPAKHPTLTTTTTPSAPATPAAPAPTSAVISLNGELMSVPVGSDFPQTGVTFSRVGAIFHLVSLTARTAKVAIAGGSYADGAPAITLRLQTPVTLQNTADGTKYTLVLEPQGTQVGAATGATTTTTASVPAVPSSGSGG